MRGAAMRGPCVRGKDCGHRKDTNLVNGKNVHGLCKSVAPVRKSRCWKVSFYMRDKTSSVI